MGSLSGALTELDGETGLRVDGTTSGICPVREQVDCINFEIVARATVPPYNGANFVPANPEHAVFIESLTNMTISWSREKTIMVTNGHWYHP